MGITLASNFDVNAALPLDSRMVVADLTARDAIAAGRRYTGLIVYVVSDTVTYQLKGGIGNGDWVEFGSGTAAATFVESFIGDGILDTFTLGADPLAIENTQVYIDGVYQQKIDSYDLVGLDISFVDIVPLASVVEVVYTSPASPLVIPNDYITTAKILDGAVTDDKITSMDAAKLTGTLPAGVLPSVNYQAGSLVTSFARNATSFADVTGLNVTITATGGRPIIIMMQGDASNSNGTYVELSATGTAELALLRGATIIQYAQGHSTASAFTSAHLTHKFIDVPIAGSHTYKIQLKTSSTGCTATMRNVKLVAYEL